MSDQIFISYRRDGGDTTAKLICETLKNKGFSVFYDFDTLKGGFFDERILTAIEECNDVVLVLPPHALDRCVNEDDWVRREISHALEHGKRIIPVMLKDFAFPKNMPSDIAEIARYNGVLFMMEYFDAAIGKIIEKLSPATKANKSGGAVASSQSAQASATAPKNASSAQAPTATKPATSVQAPTAPEPAAKPTGKKNSTPYSSDFNPLWLIVGIYAVLLIAAIVCAIAIPVARHYIIASLIGVHIVGIFSFFAVIADGDDEFAAPVYGIYLFVSIALLVTCIPFLCFAGTLRLYAIFISASLLLTSLILYIAAKSQDFDDFETFSPLAMGELAATVLLIGITLLLSGLWEVRLVLGVGAFVIALVFALIGFFRSEYDRTPDAVWQIVFASLYFAVGIAFWFINRTFAFWSMVAFAIAILRFIFLYIEFDLLFEEEYGGFVGGILGIAAFLGASVLVFFFAHHDDAFSAKNGVLRDYYGEDAVVTISEDIETVAADCFAHLGVQGALTEVYATSVKTIEERAFADCLSLETVHLGASLETIESGAFRNCKIKTICFHGTPEQWEAVEKYDGSGAWYDPDWCTYGDFELVFTEDGH